MNELQNMDQFDVIRKHIDHHGEAWFAVVDVIEILAEPKEPPRYWRDMKRRDLELGAICHQFPMTHKINGRTYQTDCANQEGLLRIIQSIPSPKAEPFRRWLAMTGSRRLDEIKENPIEAERERLRLLGFSEKEIEHRVQLKIQAGELRAEWANRGINTNQAEDLTDVIHQGTFEGMTRKDHADLKRLETPKSLQDHMTAVEIAFTMMGEASTIDEIHHTDPQGYDENEAAAKKAGETTGHLREVWEERHKRKVISDKSPLKDRQLPSGEDEVG